nr:chorismate synthase [Bacteroidota bacterium]
MPGNSFGKIFNITTFGESHGKAIGVIIDGCPAGIEIDQKFIQKELKRRKPGQSSITTSRNEEDEVHIFSGVFEGMSTGAPITLVIYNKDQKPEDYERFKDVYRPSHADYTYQKKYGIRDHRGGGRSSARETAARVAAGAVAKFLLIPLGISITAYVSQVGQVKITRPYPQLNLTEIEENIVRCPDPEIAALMIRAIEEIRDKGDSLGGMISCIIKNCPAGLG